MKRLALWIPLLAVCGLGVLALDRQVASEPERRERPLPAGLLEEERNTIQIFRLSGVYVSNPGMGMGATQQFGKEHSG